MIELDRIREGVATYPDTYEKLVTLIDALQEMSDQHDQRRAEGLPWIEGYVVDVLIAYDALKVKV